MTGPTDGQGEYQGYPFIANGSTGLPDAGTVLRSYLEHPALDLLPIEGELDDEGDIVVGQPHPLPEHGTLSAGIKADTNAHYTGSSH